MAYLTYNEEELRHLERLAKRGDDTAETMLRDELKRVTQTANSRLKRLEKSGWDNTSEAYSTATFYTESKYNSNRFKANKKMSIDDVTEQLREMRSFINKESSTVKGMKFAQNRTLEVLKEYGIEVGKEYRRQFFEFLQSDSVQDAVWLQGDYDVVFDAIAQNLNNAVGDKTKALKELQKQFDAFLTGDEAYDDFLRRVSGVSVSDLYDRHRQRESDIRSRRERRNRRRRKK